MTPTASPFSVATDRKSRPQRSSFPYYTVAATLLLVGGQVLIEPSETNLYCSLICGIGMILTLIYCFRPTVVGKFPVSTFAVVGFAVTNYIVALAAQTLDAKPLVYNLLSPRETFEATLEFQAVILLAHTAYRHMPVCLATSQWLAMRVLKPLWFFRVPRTGELWLLGMVGLSATWVSRILFVDEVGFGNVGGKFLQALVPFIVTPLFIPFRGMFVGVKQRLSPLATAALVAYFVVVVITAVAFNARAIFAVVLLTVILATILMLAMGRLHFSRRARVLMAVAAVVAVPVTSVAQNLATAMQVARGLRGTGTTADIMSETLRAFSDPEELERWRAKELSKTASGGFSGVSEIYISNEFLQRLAYTKYTDLTMTASLHLAAYQREAVRETSRQQIISILPTPIISLFGFEVDKENLSFSTGDLYADFAFGAERGGFRTGSSITNTIDVLGSLWPPVVLVIYIIMFTLLDSYALRIAGGTAISTIFFVQLYEIFARGLIYESFRNLIDGISRAYIQALFIYLVLALGARLAVAVCIPRRRSPAGGGGAAMKSTGILDANQTNPLAGGASFSLASRAERAAWAIVWALLGRWTPPMFSPWRVWLLRLFGADIEPGAAIGGGGVVWLPRHLHLGRNASLAPRVNCYNMAPISIGRNTIVSQGAHLCAGSHDVSSRAFQLIARPIMIGDDVWIAAEAFVGPGVTVGNGTVLAARGCAFQNLDALTVYRGNPAVAIRKRQWRDDSAVPA